MYPPEGSEGLFFPELQSSPSEPSLRRSSRILPDFLLCCPGILAKDQGQTEIRFSKRPEHKLSARAPAHGVTLLSLWLGDNHKSVQIFFKRECSWFVFVFLCTELAVTLIGSIRPLWPWDLAEEGMKIG